MENNKEFDEMFRSLKDREISPSDKALAQLQEALNEADRKNKKRISPIYKWMAAAVVGGIFWLGISIYSGNKSFEAPKDIVNSIRIMDSENGKEEKALESKSKVIKSEKIERTIAIANTSFVKENNLKKQPTNQIAESKQPINQVEEIYEMPQDKLVGKSEEEASIPQLVQHIPARSVEKEMQTSSQEELEALLKPMSDASLDSLLAEAKKELALDKITDQQIYSLLAEASKDIDQEQNQNLSILAAELLTDAEFEIQNERSLQKILERALEFGIVEAKNLFKSF